MTPKGLFVLFGSENYTERWGFCICHISAASGWSQELSPGLPHGQQGPKHLTHSCFFFFFKILNFYLKDEFYRERKKERVKVCASNTGCALAGSWNRKRSQDSKPEMQTWDTSIPSAILPDLACCPKSLCSSKELVPGTEVPKWYTSKRNSYSEVEFSAFFPARRMKQKPAARYWTMAVELQLSVNPLIARRNTDLSRNSVLLSFVQ